MMTNTAAVLKTLHTSVRMPVLFVGHGSPMNVIEDNVYRRGWQAMGARFGQSWPKPQLILCVSAHWLTSGWCLTGMAQPRTLHDFGGFAPELYAAGAAEAGEPVSFFNIAFQAASISMRSVLWG